MLVAEGATGVAWQDAGKVELDGATYLGFALPFSISQVGDVAPAPLGCGVTACEFVGDIWV